MRPAVFGYVRSTVPEEAKVNILLGELVLHAGQRGLDLVEVFQDVPCSGLALQRAGFTRLLAALTDRVVGVAPVPRRPLGVAELATVLAVWRYIDAARLDARNHDAYGYSAQARHDVETLGAALADVLFLHEPRDGSPLCPACSATGSPRPWPCQTWRRVMTHFRAHR